MHIVKFIAAAVVMVLGCANGWADVGMITQLSGNVTLAAGGGTQSAVPFLKIASGDKLVLANGARVQLVYFGNGRQEVWKGGNQIEIGSLESKGTGKPEISQLPTLVVNQLAKTPAAGQQGKTGMVRVRSLGNPDASAHLDKQYKELKSKSAPDDTTPEIFLLSGLIEIKEVARAREVLADLGGKPAYKAVVDHFSPLVAAATSK